MMLRKSRQTSQAPDEKILRVERLLNDYSSVIETHIQHLDGFTNAIQGFREVWQEHTECITALDHFMGSLEGTTPEKKEVVPSIETMKFPPGCIRNRSLVRRGKHSEVG